MAQNCIDYPSIKGQFGWERIGGELAIPVIVRSNGVRYSPVRIVEQEIIKTYEAVPQSVFQCITLKSFYLTLSESKLLNIINFNHCHNRYGDSCFSPKDVIISAGDVKELAKFLYRTHQIFSSNLTQFNPKMGVVKFTPDPQNPSQSLLVPYRGKYLPSGDFKKFIPQKLVENYVTTNGNMVRAPTSDWDLMYLKMLTVYCDNNSSSYITRDDLYSLDGLIYSKTRAPIIYEEYGTANNS